MLTGFFFVRNSFLGFQISVFSNLFLLDPYSFGLVMCCSTFSFVSFKQFSSLSVCISVCLLYACIHPCMHIVSISFSVVRSEETTFWIWIRGDLPVSIVFHVSDLWFCSNIGLFVCFVCKVKYWLCYVFLDLVVILLEGKIWFLAFYISWYSFLFW